ncbi:acyltransferase [Sphingomonas bacterium]|uniref:acyltransferase family protein n=1 Tax=Sphingomonas bacterium TaxID=1895847 RepID=UPI002614CC6F|nr:acyltransferase [Sphingomonas bacterium]MDB5677122.1 acyltransferase [Sphingomonas bacterium]
MERHYGMDWLRIGAFALLILYHIGMVFVPWGFHIKTAQPMDWVEIPMLLTNPWRLTMLFVVSGYASRALFAKSRGVGGFLKNRNARLLIPLVFGMAVIVPPQTWVEIVGKHGYGHGFAWFFGHDYFRFGTLFGIVMPTWNHLWFVVYLWVYTLALALLMLVPGSGKLQPVFDKLFGGGRALWAPVLFLMITQYWLFHRDDDTHDLFGDALAHLQYFPAFLFGFGLAGSRAAMSGLARYWKLSAAIAIACYAVMAGLMIAWPDFSFPTRNVAQIFLIAREIDVWVAIAALIGMAERFWNRDNGWRATLAEATFPFYIIHQTAIVLVEFWIKPFGLGPLAEFLILVPATVVACWAFYLLGREVNWLRPLIGLKRRSVAARAVAVPHVRAQPDVA